MLFFIIIKKYNNNIPVNICVNIPIIFLLILFCIYKVYFNDASLYDLSYMFFKFKEL
jgi:hypothetical protein